MIKEKGSVYFLKLPEELLQFFSEKLFSIGYLAKLSNRSKVPYIMHKKAKQLVLVLSGKGLAYINEKVYPISKGNLIFFKENVRHAFLTRHELEILCFHLPQDFGKSDYFVIGESLNKDAILKKYKSM